MVVKVVVASTQSLDFYLLMAAALLRGLRDPGGVGVVERAPNGRSATRQSAVRGQHRGGKQVLAPSLPRMARCTPRSGLARRCSCGLRQWRGRGTGAGGVERHRPRLGPVTHCAAPAFGTLGLGLRIERLALRKDGRVGASMALLGGDEGERAVAMLGVVPAHEVQDPSARFAQVSEAARWVGRTVLQGAEQGLGVGIVVAHARAAVGGNDAEVIQGCQQRAAFLRAAVVGVQDARFANATFGEHGALDQGAGVGAVLLGVHLPADDLAAVEVEDQVKVEEHPPHRAGQVGDIPAPDLVRAVGGVARRRFGRARGLGPSAMVLGVVGAQHAVEGGL